MKVENQSIDRMPFWWPSIWAVGAVANRTSQVWSRGAWSVSEARMREVADSGCQRIPFHCARLPVSPSVRMGPSDFRRSQISPLLGVSVPRMCSTCGLHRTATTSSPGCSPLPSSLPLLPLPPNSSPHLLLGPGRHGALGLDEVPDEDLAPAAPGGDEVPLELVAFHREHVRRMPSTPTYLCSGHELSGRSEPLSWLMSGFCPSSRGWAGMTRREPFSAPPTRTPRPPLSIPDLVHSRQWNLPTLLHHSSNLHHKLKSEPLGCGEGGDGVELAVGI